MSWMYVFAIVTLISSLILLAIEYEYRSKLGSLKRRHFHILVAANSAIAFAAINSLFIVILITGGEFGDGLHWNLITISVIPSLLFGIAFLDLANLKMSSVERELWWIEGMLQRHDKPVEKIEERLRQAHKKSKFTTDELQQILHNLSEIDQSLDPIAKELLADFGIEQ